MAFLYTIRLVFGIFFRSPFSPCRGGAGVIFVETMGRMIPKIKQQFPDLYQPTIVLADQTPDSENTIKWYCTEGKHNTYDMTVKAK